jgi:hypothetical protein
VLRAELNIMLEGMRYWYMHASSLGRWKERIRPILPRWGEPLQLLMGVLQIWVSISLEMEWGKRG